MVAHGRLHVVHRGVYAVGHTAVGPLGRRWAAVLACGEGAVLSHASAGAAWGLRPSASAVVDVSVGRGGRARRPGIRLHCRRSLCADDVTVLDGLPITTPARTVLDLAAGGLRGAKLEAVVDVAVHERLDFADLERLLASRQAGTAALREVVRRYAPGSVDVRSGLELRFLELCDRAGVPRPAVNVVVSGWVRDFFWADVPLVVEVDSWRWHRSPARMSEDRERDASLTLAGIPFVRFSDGQVVQRGDEVVSTLRTMLRYDLTRQSRVNPLPGPPRRRT